MVLHQEAWEHQQVLLSHRSGQLGMESVTGLGPTWPTASTCHLKEVGPPCYLSLKNQVWGLTPGEERCGPEVRGTAFQKASRDSHRRVTTVVLRV